MNVLTYEQLKQRLDAVVAENVKLVEAMRAIYTDGFLLTTATGSGDDIYLWDYICDPKEQIEQWIAKAKTTSAALAEVEVRAIEKLIAKKLKQLEAMHPDTYAFGATAMEIRSQINELQAYVVELREGRV
ncbi:hypothetical protein HZI31_06335 [Serratia fonticola]|uniref:hypothetical protein n=1 Tax=Serratia fonticola TaxID=47917 RepID=UPI0015C626A6|nr:hypothetical protein [Serratia fonticola]NYA42923.1 hypothetical protein [Serratia fonticola]